MPLRFISLILISIAALLPAIGQESRMLRAFADAPVELFPTIDRLTRLDMADYFQSGSQKPSKNAFKGDARILSVSDRNLRVQTSPVSETEIVMLPPLSAKADTIFMVLNTVVTPAPDSSAKFYTASWAPANISLDTPSLELWLTPEGKKRRPDVENAVPFIMASYTYDPATSLLVMTNNVNAYTPSEERKTTDGALLPTLSFRWNGKRFTPVKP